VIIHPVPAAPNISDNVVINTNSFNPLPIIACRDSIMLTGGNVGNNTYYWTDASNSFKSKTLSIKVTAPDSNYFIFTVVDSFGCVNSTEVKVVLDSVLPPIIPELYCPEDPKDHDTVNLCMGDGFIFYAYDSISNPNHNPNLCIPPSDAATIHWSVTPNTISYNPTSDCNSNEDADDFIPADSGWYNITATIIRINKCDTDIKVVSDSMFVRLHPLPVVTLSITGKTEICPGGNDSTMLIAKGNYPFRWSTGSTNDSIWVKNIGSYYVYSSATTIWGCSSSATAYIIVSNPPQPLVTMNPSDGLICPNDSVWLHCSGTGTFQWQGPKGPFGGNTNVVYANVPGYYYCILTDTEHCVLLSNSVLLEQYTTPFLYATPGTTICPGDTAVVHVAASVGATIQWQYPLSGHDTIQYITKAGTYTCKVVSCGITTMATITITTPYLTSAINASAKILCYPVDSAVLTADSGMSSYVWEPVNIYSQSITVDSSGTYTLTVIDSYGCTATNSVTISKSPQIRDSIIALSNVKCYSGNMGSISVGVSGGIKPYTFLWSPNGGTNSNATGLSAGTYTLLVTDTDGCTSTISAVITQPASSLNDSDSYINILCSGGKTGSATVTAWGSQPPYTYLWNPGGQTTSTITGLSSGSYTVTVTDSVGCSITSSVTLTQPPPFTDSITSINATCMNNNGSAKVFVSGGTGPYTYLWQPTGSTTDSVTGLSAGTYSVIITDANGCQDTLTVKVGFTNDLKIDITKTADTICRGHDVTFTVSGATTYLWSNGSTSSSITVSLYSDSTYWVICTSGPCTDTIPVKVCTYSKLKHSMSKIDSICSGNTVKVGINISGGKRPYSYSWNNGIMSNSPGPFPLTPDVSTSYICNVTDQCNNVTSDTIQVSVSRSAKASFVPTPDTIQSGQAISFVNTSNGANSYWWNLGDGTQSEDFSVSHSYSDIGTYLVILVANNSNNCSDTAKDFVYVTEKLTFANVFTPNGDGINDLFLIKIPNAQCFDCKIFDRWGNLIYEWTDINTGWNGTIRQTGEPAAEGVYYYIINYCNVNNDKEHQDGIVTLLRNK
jgi:gliding motility-associated-like protein